MKDGSTAGDISRENSSDGRSFKQVQIPTPTTPADNCKPELNGQCARFVRYAGYR